MYGGPSVVDRSRGNSTGSALPRGPRGARSHVAGGSGATSRRRRGEEGGRRVLCGFMGGLGEGSSPFGPPGNDTAFPSRHGHPTLRVLHEPCEELYAVLRHKRVGRDLVGLCLLVRIISRPSSDTHFPFPFPRRSRVPCRGGRAERAHSQGAPSLRASRAGGQAKRSPRQGGRTNVGRRMARGDLRGFSAWALLPGPFSHRAPLRVPRRRRHIHERDDASIGIVRRGVSARGGGHCRGACTVAPC